MVSPAFFISLSSFINGLSLSSKGGDADSFRFVGPLLTTRVCGKDLYILLEEETWLDVRLLWFRCW